MGIVEAVELTIMISSTHTSEDVSIVDGDPRTQGVHAKP